MNAKHNKPGIPMSEPDAVRAGLAAELRKLAGDKRLKPRERAELARMADAWQRTLTERKSVK